MLMTNILSFFLFDPVSPSVSWLLWCHIICIPLLIAVIIFWVKYRRKQM